MTEKELMEKYNNFTITDKLHSFNESIEIDGMINSLKKIRFDLISRFGSNIIMNNTNMNETDYYKLITINDDEKDVLNSIMNKYKKYLIDYSRSIGSFPETELYRLYLSCFSHLLDKGEKRFMLAGFRETNGFEYNPNDNMIVFNK